jgi:hypothetical protein
LTTILEIMRGVVESGQEYAAAMTVPLFKNNVVR